MNPRPLSTDDSARQDRILRARARALSEKRVERSLPGETGHEVVEFFLGDEKYAVETRLVQEFFLAGKILPIPCTPNFIRGVVSRRGRVLSVVDLGGFLEGVVPHAKEEEGLNQLVVLHQEGMEMALAVDGIGSVRHIAAAQLDRKSEAAPTALAPYVLGITTEPMIVLNAAALLSEPGLLVND